MEYSEKSICPHVSVHAGSSATPARMRSEPWQTALAAELAQPVPCFMCAETPWQKCHRRLIAEQLTARGVDVTHLLGRGRREPHALFDGTEIRAGKLYLCGAFVA